MTKLHNRLKEIRLRKEISQLKLSQISGIAPCVISNIERGRQYVFPGWKRRIASALNVSESELFPEEMLDAKEA